MNFLNKRVNPDNLPNASLVDICKGVTHLPQVCKGIKQKCLKVKKNTENFGNQIFC